MTTAVLATPPYLAFYDNDGNPLSNGLIYTYAAGTAFSVPKATYTDSTGTIQMSNPIQLDSSGRSVWWLIGSYGYVVKDSLGNTIRTTDDVTAFTTLANANDAYFQTFSGDGTTTVFTTSDDLGTEEKGLYVWVDSGTPNVVTNGTFATDTDWTKGTGWTIATGVATAAGAISTAISQTSATTLVEGVAYSVTYTITRSAGGLIPSLGGQNGTERTAAGTYHEVIVAGSTQAIAFTGNAFTGTLDNVVITLANGKGYEIQNPNTYTINGTALTFATAPKTGTNNIYVSAPTLFLGAASAAAAAAEASATAALASEVAAAASAASAIAYQTKNKWTYSNNPAMSDPSVGFVRFNNTTISLATSMAIADQSTDPTNPDLSAWVNTWDDGSGSNRGTLYVFKDTSNFALFTVNSANVDNTTWNQVSITYLSGAGTFANNDALYYGFAASGITTVTGGITALTGDVTASGAGSVAATIANNAVTLPKLATQAASTVLMNATAGAAAPTAVALSASQLVGRGATGNGGAITLGTNLSMSGTTLNVSSSGWLSDLANYTYYSDDFIGKLTTASNYSTSTSGTGASTLITGPSGGSQVTTGTTTTGLAGLYWYVAIPAARLGSLEYSALASPQVVSDGTNTFSYRVGISEPNFASEPTNGIYFRYTHGTNSGNWQAVSRAAGVETVINTAIAPILYASSTQVTSSLSYVVNAGKTSIEFFIGGVSVGTIATNIPNVEMTNAGHGILKSAGATARLANMLYQSLKVKRT